ncbi:MAG: electron transfer flavoprotein subunit beta/FixA family protein [Planctomycetota bacterium]|jgi:electron transfer flavoprotein beta subunit
MKIIVCLKRVPDTTAKIRVGGDGKAIDPQGVEFVISPYDELAVEFALRLKDKHGGETLGLCVDPDGNETVLRKALAMGLDKGVLVTAKTGFDGAATAAVLAGTLKGMEYDLLLCGKQAADDDASQVPTLLAHALGLPRVNVCTAFEPEGDPPAKAKVKRQIEGGEESLELPLPFVLGLEKGINGIHEPRYPSLKGIMAAKKKPVEKKDAAAVEPVMEVLKMELPAERPPGRIVGEGVDAIPELIRLLREEAKVI